MLGSQMFDKCLFTAEHGPRHWESHCRQLWPYPFSVSTLGYGKFHPPVTQQCNHLGCHLYDAGSRLFSIVPAVLHLWALTLELAPLIPSAVLFHPVRQAKPASHNWKSFSGACRGVAGWWPSAADNGWSSMVDMAALFHGAHGPNCDACYRGLHIEWSLKTPGGRSVDGL